MAKKLRLGRKPFSFYERAVYLADYVNRALAPNPISLTRTNLVTKPWGMEGNDQAGDCVIASRAHQMLFWTSAALGGAKGYEPSAALALQQYYKLTGGPDSGLVISTTLAAWARGAIGPDKILAYAKVNPTDLAEIRSAINLFGSVTLGVTLPTFITAALDNGEVLPWQVPTGGGMTLDPDGGHCVPIFDYDETSFTCVTWGQTMKMSLAFYQQVIGETWAVLSKDWLNAQGNSIAGLDLAQLQADWKAIT